MIMKANCLDACNYVVVFGEERDGKTVRYNNDNTVQVVNVLEPMTYTEIGADKVCAIYKAMGCACVAKMKFVEWQKANNE